jgi:RNA polymerase sigma-70 factor (ECF subfamily)
MLDEEDLTLLARSRGGDRAAFATFVRRYQGPVLRLCRAVTSSSADAEDSAQETFVQAWRAIRSPDGDKRGDASVKAWLLTIARHAALRRHRRRVGEPSHTDSLDAVDTNPVAWGALGEAAGWGQDPEAQAAAVEQRACVRQALQRLSESDREVIMMRDLLGLSGEEAARALGLSVAAEKSRLHRARLALMAHLGACREVQP